VALRLVGAEPAPLRALASDAVQGLDALRAPLDAAALQRRAQGLDAAGRARLERWGYAHVLEGWRFHMTLSDALADDAARAALLRATGVHFGAALGVPVRVDALAHFVEPGPGAPLQLVRRIGLGQAARSGASIGRSGPRRP